MHFTPSRAVVQKGTSNKKWNTLDLNFLFEFEVLFWAFVIRSFFWTILKKLFHTDHENFFDQSTFNLIFLQFWRRSGKIYYYCNKGRLISIILQDMGFRLWVVVVSSSFLDRLDKTLIRLNQVYKMETASLFIRKWVRYFQIQWVMWPWVMQEKLHVQRVGQGY